MAEVYLDNSATTRVDNEVAALVLDVMTNRFGNPSSLHRKGLEAALCLDQARRQVAAALDAPVGDVTFTSGGTEANNLAILGSVYARKRRGNKVVAAAWEHSSVLSPMKQLEAQGFEVTYIQPDEKGALQPEAVANAVDEKTLLVSTMLVNSEIGAISPITQIAKEIKRKNPAVLLHCDAVQGFCKLPFSAAKSGADLVTVSSHKIHGPKGAGALYHKGGVRLLPLVFGGGQESTLRPGTENLPALAGFGLAAQKMHGQHKQNHAHVAALYEFFVKRCAEMPGVCINSPTGGTPYICNLSVPGYRSEILLHFLAEKGVFVSSGSACAKGAKSHVLKALGLADNRIDSALRISLCKDNTQEELEAFFETLAQAMEKILRR